MKKNNTPCKLPECEKFPGRLNEICNGTAIVDGRLIDPAVVTHWRGTYGLPPIGEPVTTEAAYPPVSPPAPQSSLSAGEPPSLLIRGWNFASAMTRWTLAGMPRRTQAEIDERLAICQACPFLVDNHCTKCGCACVEQNQLINKLALATEKCPEGKWT